MNILHNILAPFKHILKYLFGVLFILFNVKKYKSSRALKNAVDFVFSKHAFSIAPIQYKSEIFFLLALLKQHKPKYILELGTARGGSLYLICTIASEDAQIISVDLPKGSFGGGYGFWRIPFYQYFASTNQKIHLIRGNSHDDATLKRVLQILKGNKLDFLFIDADHSYNGVKQDYLMYSTLVKQHGFIALHDIYPSSNDRIEVHYLWREIKNKHKSLEIRGIENLDGGGIGIIKKFSVK